MGERFHDGDEARLPFVFVQAINLELSQYPTAGAAAADRRIRWPTDACTAHHEATVDIESAPPREAQLIPGGVGPLRGNGRTGCWAVDMTKVSVVHPKKLDGKKP